MLPPISSLPNLPTQELASILDTLFEPCTQLHTLSIDLLRSNTFSSYDALIAAVGAQLTALFESTSTSDTEWLNAILSAHPRLGEKVVESEQSRMEQAGLNANADGGGEEDAEELRVLNEEYEKVFPGLRYVYVLQGSISFSVHIHLRPILSL